jgi:hypothetical protein
MKKIYLCGVKNLRKKFQEKLEEQVDFRITATKESGQKTEWFKSSPLCGPSRLPMQMSRQRILTDRIS